jgi:hypothetical protein
MQWNFSVVLAFLLFLLAERSLGFVFFRSAAKQQLCGRSYQHCGRFQLQPWFASYPLLRCVALGARKLCAAWLLLLWCVQPSTAEAVRKCLLCRLGGAVAVRLSGM